MESNLLYTEENKKNFTNETLKRFKGVHAAIEALLDDYDVRNMLCLDFYPRSGDCIADVIVDSIDNNVVTCHMYITRDWESYRTLDVNIPIDYLTKTGAVEAALAQRKAERDEKERRKAELQNDEKYQEYLKLKEQFENV